MEIAREFLFGRLGEGGQVACAGQLRVIGQTGGVDKIGLRHAQSMGLAGHSPCKTIFIARELFADSDRDVVRRAGDDRLDGVFDADRLAGGNAKLGWRLRRRMFRNGNLRLQRDLAAVEFFKQQVERHDFGQRRRMTSGVLIHAVKRLARIFVDHDGRERGVSRRASPPTVGLPRVVMMVNMAPITRLRWRGARADRQGRQSYS